MNQKIHQTFFIDWFSWLMSESALLCVDCLTDERRSVANSCPSIAALGRTLYQQFIKVLLALVADVEQDSGVAD